MNDLAFREFSDTLSAGGQSDALEWLERTFIDAGEFHKLFEILKMRCRHDLKLPVVFDSKREQDLPAETQDKLEKGMLAACKTVGRHLFESGKPEEGWMYLQPVGDRAFAAELLRAVPVDEESVAGIIDIGLGQGVDAAYGFRLLLEQSGVCNAITTIDVKSGQGEFDPATRQTVCGILLQYFYQDLRSKIGDEIKERGLAFETEATLGQWLDAHAWIVTETGHHVDATHLSSVVRLAKQTEDAAAIEMARDLCLYGLRLPEDFQYRGEVPFESTFEDHLVYFNGLLKNDVDAAEAFLRKQAETCHEFDRAVVLETLVDFLVKVGRREDALDVAIEHLAGKLEPVGIAPNLFDIANDEDLRKRLAQFYLDSADLLGYAVCQLS